MAKNRMLAPGIATLPKPPVLSSRFAAIDFETADYGRDSACSLAVVLVDGTEIVEQHYYLIRPPRPRFEFTYIHGITWQHVAAKPSFRELWPEIEAKFAGVEFVAAHNASFDRGVLAACCAAGLLPAPSFKFQCTVSLARRAWNLKPARLPDVCRHLKLPLKHHDAASDALACANIVLAARRAGISLKPK